jgi:hypothetical protein
MQIFATSDTILDVLHLSATNRLLNAVWLEHRDPIIESTLGSTLPAYDEATELAILQTRLESSIDDPPTPSLCDCLPILLRNADLCASACLAYSTAHPDAKLPAASYYFLRRAGLGFVHYQLRDDLYLELRAMSMEALKGPCGLSKWLQERASWKEKVRQGVREDWQYNEDDILCQWETLWDYAEYVVTGASDDIWRGAKHLPLMMEGYDPWDNSIFFNNIVNPKIMM